MMRNEITKAKELGYSVESIRPENDVYRVEGFGLSTQYNEDNAEAWESLISGHEERKRQSELTDEEREKETRLLKEKES